MKPKITVVIPAYNENEDIIPLINSLEQARSITEIIVVDDHSDDKYAQIYQQIEGITLIRHEVNKGKSLAVRTGINAAKSDNILVLDADLLRVTPSHIDQLATIISDYDILCLIRGDDSPLGKVVGSTYITRGEHLFTKEFINKYQAQLFDGTRWGFDNNINDIILQNPVQFAFVEMVGVTHKMKSKKYSFFRGAWLDLQMFLLVPVKKYKLINWITTYIKLLPYIRKRIHITGDKLQAQS